jgi:hypothetical protein
MVTVVPSGCFTITFCLRAGIAMLLLTIAISDNNIIDNLFISDKLRTNLLAKVRSIFLFSKQLGQKENRKSRQDSPDF